MKAREVFKFMWRKRALIVALVTMVSAFILFNTVSGRIGDPEALTEVEMGLVVEGWYLGYSMALMSAGSVYLMVTGYRWGNKELAERSKEDAEKAKGSEEEGMNAQKMLDGDS